VAEEEAFSEHSGGSVNIVQLRRGLSGSTIRGVPGSCKAQEVLTLEREDIRVISITVIALLFIFGTLISAKLMLWHW